MRTSFPFRRVTLSLIAIASLPAVASASGSDNSSNYGSWTDGSGAGSGFGAWQFHYDNHGSGFAGLEKAFDSDNMKATDGSTWKLYAVDFNSAPVGDQLWEEATAYRSFNTPLTTAGSTFNLSFEHGGIANPGSVGFSLRNGNVTGSGNREAGARFTLAFEGGDNFLSVTDSSGSHEIPGLGFTYFGYDAALTLTGSDAYSLTVTRYNSIGLTDAPITVTGTLAGSGSIDSFSMFNWNYSAATDGANHDAYFNRLSYTNGTLAGDFNSDGVLNPSDVDLLFAAVPGTVPPANPIFDVNGDGKVVNTAGSPGSDVDYWLHALKQSEYGDADLSGQVNFDDLLVLAQNYGKSTLAHWSDGNFNGDGVVNFDDLLALAQHYGFGVSSLQSDLTSVVGADFAADWALAHSLVPEPTSLSAFALISILHRRRR